MIKRLKIYIINQFGFTRSEANGVLVLSLIVLASFTIPILYVKSIVQKQKEPPFGESLAKWYIQVDETVKTAPDPAGKKPVFGRKKFHFDPNTASLDDLRQLGFPESIGQRIVKYREAGGVFVVKNDLGKIYAINQEILNDLWEYIDLPEKTSNKNPSNHGGSEKIPYKRLNLNQLEPSDMEFIKGIGPVLSQRIVKYRNLLGGFYSFDQLSEVYHFPDSLLYRFEAYFYLDTLDLVQIRVNEDSLDRLAVHPYLTYNQARAMINYRQLHGPYEKPEDLMAIRVMDDSTLTKLIPYLNFTSH
ncbi:MAG: helix-hairpin-helix domain-containing protein [Cyclobacteriaceae bacterium]|nr:helix-hairpin-helix domain-containing protein [Cyclobacteriaceae bacterium]